LGKYLLGYSSLRFREVIRAVSRTQECDPKATTEVQLHFQDMTKDWDAVQDEIRELSFNQKKSLEDVKELMERKYKFRAS
jgi:hypothetical protein